MTHLNLSYDVFDKYEDDKFIIAVKKIELICKVFNDGWCPNWNDTKENKHYPLFNMSLYGKGLKLDNDEYISKFPNFMLYRSHCDNMCGAICTRHCFKNEEDCEYAAKQFIDIYYDFFVWNVRFDNINKILK
jgi:hypothetical protein